MSSFKSPTWPISVGELRKVLEGERFICLFSGGKDSALALLKAMDTGQPIALVQCVSPPPHRSYYHHLPVEVAQKQAAALGVPLFVSQATPWDQPAQMIELYRSFASQGVQSVVFGDLHLERNARWQAALCEQAGLTPRMPLWQLEPELVLQEMQRRKIQSIITWVNPQKLSPRWIGKLYDGIAYRAFQQAGIDPMGEKGEFHTTFISCDLFSSSIDLGS